MKYAAPLLLLATPAVAHDGAHLHPHGVEAWPVGLALLALTGTAAIVAKVRR